MSEEKDRGDINDKPEAYQGGSIIDTIHQKCLGPGLLSLQSVLGRGGEEEGATSSLDLRARVTFFAVTFA